MGSNQSMRRLALHAASDAERAPAGRGHMSYTKTIVCLANSRKPPSGRCVAGREVTPSGFGAWVRPVSARPTQEISEEERRYRDGTDPKVLDVIAIELTGARPQHHQRENHLIDDGCYWVKQRAVSWSELQAAVEDPAGPLWIHGHSSSYGRNDRVPEDRTSELGHSLCLVRPEGLNLVVGSEGGSLGRPRRRVRARSDLSDHSYCVVVTDPWMERRCLAGQDGETRIADALLCVSLGESFHGFAYKLVAAVITRQRAGG